MPARKIKLYVWEGVFSDWFPGIAFALAYDVRQARKLIAQEYIGGRATDAAMRELAGPPKIIRLNDKTQPQAWQLSGGA